MEIKNLNAAVCVHCDDSEGFSWAQSLEALSKMVPGDIKKRLSNAFESSEYPQILFRKVMRDSRSAKWKTEFFPDRMEMTFLGKKENPEVYPEYTHVVFVEAPGSYIYKERIRFMGCYKLACSEGKKFIFKLVSREFDLSPADDAQVAA